MAPQPCPRCKLLRSPGVRLCECGWDFATLDGGVRAGWPSGIAGWLLLLLLNLVGAIMLNAFAIIVIVTAATIGSRQHPMRTRLLWFEGLGSAVLLVGEVLLLYFFLQKRSIVPKLMMLWLLASVVLMFGDALLVSTVPGLNPASAATQQRNLVRSVIACVIWIPYFFKSKRVAATFVR